MNGLDLSIIVIYLLAMIGIGVYFSFKNKSSNSFSVTAEAIPGWALGLSFYATFLSVITFLGDPGKSFGSNWNPFVFSISIPFASFVASKYFVKFYRNSGEISAYTHLEHQIGSWARTYSMLCFVLTQLARMGTIFYGVALTVNALTGYDMRLIIIIAGICIIFYTILGGMSAVIWTEVLQAIIKTFGAILILWIILQKVSMDSIAQIGHAKGKFALGSFDLDFSTSSFWVIFLYGFFINLTNFGVDQNYIQRYHSANSTQEAQKSIWLCAIYYVPVSALFFFIGTALFVYYQTYPELILELKHQVGAEKGIALSQLKESDFGDRVLPFFLKTQIPKGFLGLLVAALLSAAMSTMSSGMNSSATVFLKDVYLRHVQPQADPKKQIRILQLSTLGMGILGMSFGIGMIGVKSLLDIWWKLSGIFAAGMLGLFLIGFLLKNLKSNKVKLALSLSVILIAWMSFKDSLPQPLQLPFDSKMTIVLGTGSMLIITWLLHKLGKNE